MARLWLEEQRRKAAGMPRSGNRCALDRLSRSSIRIHRAPGSCCATEIVWDALEGALSRRNRVEGAIHLIL